MFHKWAEKINLEHAIKSRYAPCLAMAVDWSEVTNVIRTHHKFISSTMKTIESGCRRHILREELCSAIVHCIQFAEDVLAFAWSCLKQFGIHKIHKSNDSNTWNDLKYSAYLSCSISHVDYAAVMHKVQRSVTSYCNRNSKYGDVKGIVSNEIHAIRVVLMPIFSPLNGWNIN